MPCTSWATVWGLGHSYLTPWPCNLDHGRKKKRKLIDSSRMGTFAVSFTIIDDGCVVNALNLIQESNWTVHNATVCRCSSIYTIIVFSFFGFSPLFFFSDSNDLARLLIFGLFFHCAMMGIVSFLCWLITWCWFHVSLSRKYWCSSLDTSDTKVLIGCTPNYR